MTSGNSEYQKRLRMRLSIFAWAYEQYNESLISDSEYDRLSLLVDVNIPTDRPDLDEWFKKNFVSDSGIWIHKHPELKRIDEITKSLL